MADYNYSVANDTANAAVNLDKLAEEIRASSIIAAFGGAMVLVDALTISFKDTLSAEDAGNLTAIVRAHSAAVVPTVRVVEVKVQDINTQEIFTWKIG